MLTHENKIGPILLSTKFTGSSKLYKLSLRAFQLPIDHRNCYIKDN